MSETLIDSGSQPAVATGPALEVHDLSVSVGTPHGRAAAVRSVNFSVAAGRTLGIVGESGCGKSLTLLSLPRLLPKGVLVEDGSSVRLLGREVMTLGQRDLEDVRGEQIGFVFQDPMTALNPVYKVGYQVAQVLRRHLGLRRRAASARALETLRSVGFPDPRRVASSYPHQLSGGMRQRAVIAIAIAAEPKVLLADEPTTALDVTTQAAVLELLDELQRERDMAMILVSHDLGLIGEHADELCVMYAGSVIETGRADRVLHSPSHPYTRALLESAPSLSSQRGEPLPVIHGGMPPIGEQITGCAFRPRCPVAFDRCTAAPPLLQAPSGLAACWHHDSGDKDAAATEGRTLV
jgi:peptide/nickel transport system ATP-binding protein